MNGVLVNMTKDGMTRVVVFLLAGLLAACSEKAAQQVVSERSDSHIDVSEVTEPDNADELNILVFGDSGYQLSYIEQKYFNSPYKTVEEYIASDQAGWEGKNKSIESYRVPLLEYHKASGSFMPAAGQLPVAEAMTEYCAATDCDFGAMLGDNIYPDGATIGADGVDDAQRFDDLLSAPYQGLADLKESFQIYATLGNHDWHTSKEGALAQVAYMQEHPMLYMDGLFYSVVPPGAEGEVELFIVDTEMLLQTVPVRRAVLNPDGSENQEHERYASVREFAVPRTAEERQMLNWFEEALRTSTARHKIVLGHHPFWSAGGEKFEQARVIRALVRPAVCEHADAYFAGHEHTLEVYLDSCADTGMEREKPLLQLVSGAAGKQRGIPGNYIAAQDQAYPQRELLYAEGWVFGFAGVYLSGDQMRVELYAVGQDGSMTQLFDYSL